MNISSLYSVHNVMERFREYREMSLCKGQGWQWILDSCDLQRSHHINMMQKCTIQQKWCWTAYCSLGAELAVCSPALSPTENIWSIENQSGSRTAEQPESSKNGRTFLSQKSGSCSPQHPDIYRLLLSHKHGPVQTFLRPATNSNWRFSLEIVHFLSL